MKLFKTDVFIFLVKKQISETGFSVSLLSVPFPWYEWLSIIIATFSIGSKLRQ